MKGIGRAKGSVSMKGIGRAKGSRSMKGIGGEGEV
jgi:hypothetical protein